MQANNPQHNLSNMSGQKGFQSVYEDEENDVMLFPDMDQSEDCNTSN